MQLCLKSTANQQQINRVIESLIFLTNLVFLTGLYALNNLRIQVLLVWLLFSITYIVFGIQAKRNLFSLFLSKELARPSSFFKLIFDQLLLIIIAIKFSYDMINVAFNKNNMFPRSTTLERQQTLAENAKNELIYFTIFTIIYFLIQIIIIFKQKKSGK